MLYWIQILPPIGGATSMDFFTTHMLKREKKTFVVCCQDLQIAPVLNVSPEDLPLKTDVTKVLLTLGIQVWPLTEFCSVSFLWIKMICLKGKSMTCENRSRRLCGWLRVSMHYLLCLCLYQILCACCGRSRAHTTMLAFGVGHSSPTASSAAALYGRVLSAF